MLDQRYHFDAFISYRHTERDIKIVDKIQKLIENYRSPCDGEHIKKGERIRKVFTDRSELPLSADLGASIDLALAQSHFFVVIASPEYSQSRWCMKELRTFLDYNQNSTDHILFVQVDGPPSCITDILSAAGLCIEQDSFREPLYINANSLNVKEGIKIIKKEYLRLASVLIGCSYDSLYRRHKRAKVYKILITAVLTLLIGTILGMVFAVQYNKRKIEEDYRQIDASIVDIKNLLRDENHIDALNGMKTLYNQYGQNKTYAEYLAEHLELSALKAGYVHALSAFASEPLPPDVANISSSSDGKYVILFGYTFTEDERKMHVFLYDTYLNKLSEHSMPVNELNDEIYTSHYECNVDYYESDKTFEIEYILDDTKSEEEILGRRLIFSADGQLLSSYELTADEDGRTSLAVRDLYRRYTPIFGNAVCMSTDHVYMVTTGGEDNELYSIVSVSADEQFELIATSNRTSKHHYIDSVSITSDDRFILIKETRGVYNDILTVCDTKGEWEVAQLDLGNHTINDIHYRFDSENQEACFLLNLHMAGEIDVGLIAEIRITSDSMQLPNCEIYAGKPVYDYLLTEQGYIYIINNRDVKIIATRNMCLPEQLSGMDKTPFVDTDIFENDLIENTAKFSTDSTEYMQSVTLRDFTITPNIARMHHITPVSFSGYDIGVGIYDETGNEIVEFYSDDYKHAYFNKQNNVFGLIDYSYPENSEMFRLYDFYSMMELLQ